MSASLDILKKVWGHQQFRPLQENIVDAILADNDVLALLPTGGGKSICFQLPALMKEGVCLVVTPLIALMKDQVEQLRARGIKAESIYAGLGKREIDIILDNCIYGRIKFLYLSPERLQSELVIERVKKMVINLLVVDEAHCISQWGYDFRPSYLQIAEFRAHIPEVSIVALTATATEEVKKDIVDKLKFKEESIFQASYARSNLSYSVRLVEDKEGKLLEVLTKVKGSAVVYVGTRKATKEIAQFLYRNGIMADYYHAGLSYEQRSAKQDNWIKNKTRVIVATNAFGMGIDKPDVRTVIHLHLPTTLESYYQEAGRAGRDGKKAYAVVLYYRSDIEDLKNKIRFQHPTIELLKRVYQCLANYYKIAVGSSAEGSYDFDLATFVEVYNLESLPTYYAIKKLEDEGLVQLNESFHHPSKLMFTIDNKELYQFLIANGDYDHFVKTVLRMYGGELFTNLININENSVGLNSGVALNKTYKYLQALNEMGIVLYDQQKDKPQFSFVGFRYDVNSIPVDVDNIEERKRIAESKVDSISAYLVKNNQCRSQILLYYFGEIKEERCGVCDNCIEEKKRFVNNIDHKVTRSKIIDFIGDESKDIDEIIQRLDPLNKDQVIDVIRQMLDFGEVSYDEMGRLQLL